MKKIIVEWFRYDKNGQTCCRCENSFRVVHKVIAVMKPALKNMKIELELKEVMLTDDQSDLSNTVMINGKNIEDILGEKESDKTSCPSCSELTGTDARCRTFSFRGSILESLTEEMLMEAIVAEIGAPRPLEHGQAVTSCTCKT